jgi:hypothetical protein
MKPKQEPKYRAVTEHYPENDGLGIQFRDGYLINRASGERIPDDEPVFIFRARDVFASQAIGYYLGLIAGQTPIEHQNAVRSRVRDFERFAANHPERMKTPDTAAQDPRP